MIISVASGKGGTGKTTVAVSLTHLIPHSVYIDCDVEEPNGHLLLKPSFQYEKPVFKIIPEIDYQRCTFCNKCVELCRFNSLINLKTEILVFEEMCHSCGVCFYFCPENAIKEKSKEIGIIRAGLLTEDIRFFDGLLRIGEASAVPLIKEVLKNIDNEKINIIDSPPGTSCSMVEAVHKSDYCILVTESSPFGLSDLKQAVDVLKTIGIPFGVVINKYDPEFTEMEEYLTDSQIDLLLTIPFDPEIAEAYSNGIMPVMINDKYVSLFNKMIQSISLKLQTEKVDA